MVGYFRLKFLAFFLFDEFLCLEKMDLADPFQFLQPCANSIFILN